MDVEAADGKTVTKVATATGLNFFQARKQKAETGTHDLDEITKRNQMMADTIRDDGKAMCEDHDHFEPEKHTIIDLEKIHSEYKRFNSRFDDDELLINDTINCLVPPNPETSNVL